jgi:hypothetical protein
MAQFIMTGQCFEELVFTIVITSQSLGKIIIQTCKAIPTVLNKNTKIFKFENFVN